MGNHITTIIPERGQFYAACSCRHQSPLFTHQWEAEDWENLHHQSVQRIRALLAPRNVPLGKTYEHYRRMENDPDTPAGDRALWKQLADEIGHRLGMDAPDSDQPTLL